MVCVLFSRRCRFDEVASPALQRLKSYASLLGSCVAIVACRFLGWQRRGPRDLLSSEQECSRMNTCKRAAAHLGVGSVRDHVGCLGRSRG